MAKPKIAGNFPAVTVKGSLPFRLSAGDVKSALKHGAISLAAFVPTSVIAFSDQILHAVVTAAIAAAVGVTIKFLQRFSTDTR